MLTLLRHLRHHATLKYNFLTQLKLDTTKLIAFPDRAQVSWYTYRRLMSW